MPPVSRSYPVDIAELLVNSRIFSADEKEGSKVDLSEYSSF